MTREIRNDDRTGWFHVTNRGARKYDVFIDDTDRRKFVNLLAEATTEGEIEVVGFALMATHYHLVLHCPVGNLSSSMQWLGSTYTRWFNRVHGFSGGLFESRFHSVEITSDEYLLTATRYVHRNPLEVGLDINRYRWSSYHCYIGSCHQLFDLEIVAHIPIQLAGGSDRYRLFVEQDLPADKVPFSNGVRALTGGRNSRTAPSLCEIDNALFVVDSSNTSRRVAQRKQLAVLIAADGGAHSIGEMARHHGFGSESSVRSALRRARQRVGAEPNIARRLEAAKDHLKLNQVSDT